MVPRDFMDAVSAQAIRAVINAGGKPDGSLAKIAKNRAKISMSTIPMEWWSSKDGEIEIIFAVLINAAAVKAALLWFSTKSPDATGEEGV